MATCLSVLLLASAIQLLFERGEYHEETIDSISCYAEMIGDNCRAALAFEDAEDVEETLKSLKAESSIVFACVYTEEGKVLAHYQHPGLTDKLSPPICQKEGYRFENDYFKLFKQINENNETIGTVYIQLDLSQIKAMLWLKAGTITLIVLACSIVAYLVSSRLQRVISKPILSLAEVARAVSEKKDYSTRAPKQNNDEVGSLIDAFNEMLEQIQQRDLALIDAKNQLETRVKERTAELTNANQRLTAEVTERVKAEEKFRMLFEEAIDAIFIADVETGILLDCNSAGTRLVSREKSELIGKSQKILHPPEENEEEFSESFKKYISEKRDQTIETQVITRTGEIKEVAIKTNVLEIEGKKALHGIFRDVTERKQAEEALRTNEAQLSNAMKIAHLGYWEYDVADDQFAFNDQFYDIFHTTAKQVGGYTMKPARYAELFLHPDDRQVVAIEMKKALETTDPQYNRQLEHRIVYATGEIGYISVRFVVVKDKQGRTIKTFGANQDITDRKRAEIELKNTHEKLLETSRMAGMAEVAADVLHNVGNVLNSINVSTTVITEKVSESEVANLEKLASIVNDHIEDLGTFFTEHPQGKHIPVYLTEVSKLLIDEQAETISRLQVLSDNVQHIKDIVSTQQSYAKVSGVEVTTSITRLVEDAIQINSAGLQRHGTRLIREFEELPDVEINKQKVLQILVNLISNAKYASSSSEKEEKIITIRIYKHVEDQFRIVVSDNGVGISRDNLTRIFSHGFTTKKHGHGFGLHSSALASKEIGGSLTVHSDGVRQGAAFTLELPFKPAEIVK